MATFRRMVDPSKRTPAQPPTWEQLRSIMEEVLHPKHFFIIHPLTLEWEFTPKESCRWEIYRGRLMEPRHTREECQFVTWNIFLVDEGVRSNEPILSLKLNAITGEIHIVRGLHCYVWENIQNENNEIHSQETTAWIREWMGTVYLPELHTMEDIRDELICRIFYAITGLSKLPLTSPEAPLPAYSLGHLGYVFQDTDRVLPMSNWQELLEHGWHGEINELERIKLMELLLRTVPAEEITPLVDQISTCKQSMSFTSLLRGVVNHVSLSPYTNFVDNLLALARELSNKKLWLVAEHIDFLSYVLRQLARHLTSYDLITFHHNGANYPDALFLDAAFSDYNQLIESHPDFFQTDSEDDAGAFRKKLLRRRALRQAWLLRHYYQGHAVPDVPTSPGETTRVLPEEFGRVHADQIHHGKRRRRKLYVHAEETMSATGLELLSQSWHDLQQWEELLELGLALFIDRPLSIKKVPGEPDQTLLFSHVAFSRSVARQRLELLAKKLPFATDEVFLLAQQKLLDWQTAGIAASKFVSRSPRVVSLADANRVVDDFHFLWTTRGTVQAFLAQFDSNALANHCDLAFLTPEENCLILPAPDDPRVLICYDSNHLPRLKLQILDDEGYVQRGGEEVPRGGLLAIKKWHGDNAMEWREESFSHPIPLPPKI